jgi:hypothetical protein
LIRFAMTLILPKNVSFASFIHVRRHTLLVLPGDSIRILHP